ncbi:hypothetical protein [Methylogaea oryzae]|uniref:Uncharacterized protein n=1 Tax=Methylogaea oryzae TaxID=1295382 RepID=A0A8D5AJA4_9GAMM|nr:hypothetical protein [Methylogaea oryzae]BBL72206.1 hypothetical protein MoryE10_28120 [Methylogaea oryzae]
MQIDQDGNMELSAEENQMLMDKLDIAPQDYDDPPVEIESVGVEESVATFKASNTRTGKSVTLEFELAGDED